MKCLRSQMPNEPLVQGITTRQAAYVKGKQVADGGLGNFVGTALATQVSLPNSFLRVSNAIFCRSTINQHLKNS